MFRFVRHTKHTENGIFVMLSPENNVQIDKIKSMVDEKQ